MRNEEEERLFETPASFYREPQNAASESYEQMTPTSSREDAKEKHISEQSYVQFPDTKEFPISGQETLSLNCKLEPTATSPENPITNTQEEGCSQDGSKQSSFEPPGDSKDHLIDYNSTAEAQSTPYEDLSTNQGHSRDAEFHIKQEEEMPSFDSGNCTGLQMQTGHMETEVQSIGQETLLTNRGSWNSSFSFAPIPVHLPGPIFRNSFTEQRNFQNRDNTRTGPRPTANKVLFKCEFCNKTYPFPSLLKAHYLKHTEGKQRVCGYCGKFFKWEYSLRRHEKMHLHGWKS